MLADRSTEYLLSILHELRSFPVETEWVEFKRNNAAPEEVGEYISALSNSAALFGKASGYLIWGVDDQTHDIIGTNFNPRLARMGNEALENWLLRLLSPKINFHFYELSVEDKTVVLLEIAAAFRHPVSFKDLEYIRVGSYKKKLKEFQEKERELWRVFDHIPFEREIAAENVNSDEVLRLLDYPSYFDLLATPLPEGPEKILLAFEADEMVSRSKTGKWNITNLGAILFSKNLGDFRNLKRKTIRIILYQGDGRIETIREIESSKGYASSFESLIASITSLLPSNEIIGQALRKTVPMFPELAIRELVANSIIHQDFHVTGTSPRMEIFSNRIEITNPGLPLVKTDRFLDSPPKSRNEALASFMRRSGICEERGSGVDKIVFQTELFQLPAPIFETSDDHTHTVLFAHRELKDMDKADRVRACYLHACLKYVERSFMTNTTLRERFGIEEKNSAIASRIIKETLEAKLIHAYAEDSSKKFMKYVPWWVK